VIVTHPNDDAGSAEIIRAIEDLAARNVPGFQFHKSLGRRLYHGVLNLSQACLGNSSSGIKETPVFGCPTVNIGTRQRGRLRAENVIDVDYRTPEILAALERCLFDESWRARAKACENPYWAGGAGRKIADILAGIPLDQTLLCKKMTF
jgi:UDP-N-acetylglucosamine 2-epimerase (non-hydrolysing)/GDP/UDP-N,N'-diacetylbacillosamine 2-epimerase (hydrolysing)